MLINFISNSIKFTNNGNISIILEDFDEFNVSIEIIDNGSGIEKEKYFKLY